MRLLTTLVLVGSFTSYVVDAMNGVLFYEFGIRVSPTLLGASE